ncbi:unnamed protein product, partial [Brenthis ino]
MNDSKEKISHYTCKNHTARSEKDLFRVCPSKLSKEELENLYFALLDSNIQQKKTINTQRDQIKVLNTKVHRMTAQKYAPACNKDCCSSSMAIINEQKATIADLKKTNERFSERIKTLNMRLCSAKQFLKRSPQSNSYCTKCHTSTPSFKNLSTSALYTKRSESNLQAAATSSQFLDRDKVPNKMTQIASTQVDMTAQDGTCQQNKCRTTMDELKQKIADLEEELDKTHKGYCERLNKLEAKVNSLHGENARVRAENTSSLEKLQGKEKESTVLLQKLRSTEAQCDNLNAQLIIEKSKVSELETQVKAGDISEQIARALEIHLKRDVLLVPNNTLASCTVESIEKFNMNSDDSGYAEINRSQFNDKKENKDEEIPKSDKDMSQHIAELQAQIDSIKHTMKQQNRRTADIISEDSPLQEKSNESNKVAETSSSLSNHIFATPMKHLERSDQGPSTLRNNILVSTEDVAELPNSGLTLQNINSNIPLPIKENCMPNVHNTLNSRTLNDKIEIKYEGVNEVDNEIILKKSNDQKYKESKINDVEPKLCIEKDFPEIDPNFKTLDASPNGRSSLKKKVDYTEGDVDGQYSNNENENTNMKITDFKNNDKFCNKYNSENKCGIVEKSGKDFDNKMNELLVFNNDAVTKDVATDEEKSSSSQKSVGQSTFVIETKQNRETNKDASVDTDEQNLSVKANSTDEHKSGRTYSLARASPDNTDREISSLTDLPREIDDRGTRCRSPGEECAATLSASCTAADSASLSEGELPVSTGVKRMPLAEVEMKDKMTESIGQQSSIYKMEEALHSISSELARCRRLLRARGQVTSPAAIRTFSYPYIHTLPLQ